MNEIETLTQIILRREKELKDLEFYSLNREEIAKLVNKRWAEKKEDKYFLTEKGTYILNLLEAALWKQGGIAYIKPKI